MILGEHVCVSLEQLQHAAQRSGLALALTIETLGARQELHLGVLVLSEGEGATVLHMSGHQRLKREALSTDRHRLFLLRPRSVSDELWVDRMEAIAGLWGRVWDRVLTRGGADEWAFAIAPETSVRVSGQPESRSDEHTPGFTCSTFALKLFEAVGYPLVRSHTWPPPDAADRAWQEEVVRTLQRYFPAHAFGMLDEVGAVPRYRPEQVACAAASDRHPAMYEDVREVADCVARMLRAAS